MRATFRILAAAAFSLFPPGPATLLTATPTDACSVLTPAQVSSVLGIPVANGTYDMPGDTKTCTWIIAKGGAVTFHLQTVDFFHAGQGTLAGPERTSVSGVGDEAYYLNQGPTTSLAVRKGGAAFKVAVYSSDLTLDQRTAIEKNMAQQALSKF